MVTDPSPNLHGEQRKAISLAVMRTSDAMDLQAGRRQKRRRRHAIPRAADFSFRLSACLTVADNRMQQILQPDASKHLRADTIGDAIDDFGPIL
jgi:hypothetical protein